VDREVEGALTRYVRGAIVAYVLLVAALGYALWRDSHDRADRRADSIAAREQVVNSGNAVAVQGCNRDFVTTKHLRDVLINAAAFQRAALKRGDISPAQYSRAITYYNSQLAGLPFPDCRHTLHILTDNPQRTVHIPTPLYKHG